MKDRTGEKVGWIGGWSGGFIWLLILSGIWLIKGQLKTALAGITLVAAAAFCIFWFAPWKHPTTPYWKLLLPIYAAFFLSICFAALFGGFTGFTVDWWSLFWLFPLLIPLVTMGKRTWKQ